MVRELRYDEVFDAQKHFRALLDSVARPGKVNVLESGALNRPPGFNAASALVAFALMGADSTFEAIDMHPGVIAYLIANTNARHTPADKAEFLFARGSESPDFLESVNCGTLLYPDTAPTVILQLESAGTSSTAGGLRLALEGPGIDGRSVLFVHGLNADLLLALQARNAEFPLGLDAILTFADESGAPAIAALPRTTRVTWEIC